MAEYTPTIQSVRDGYVWLSAEDNPGARELAGEDFDRFLARVRLEAARSALDGLVPMLLARRPQCPAREGDGVIGYQCGLEQGHGGRHEILPDEFRDRYSIHEYRDARYPETED